MGAEIVNRWLSDAEISAILLRYQAVLLSHTDASQSGVVATAFGAGLPVVVTPVGGLTEQVENGVTGIVANSVSASGLAQAVEQLLVSPAMYQRFSGNIASIKHEQSNLRFVKMCVAHTLSSSRSRKRDQSYCCCEASARNAGHS
jgi:glycosyltransferase involved in cell wall biosynthesis